MSDHGETHSPSGSNAASLLGTLTMIGVPISMIVLLGISGFAFIKGSGLPEVEEPEAAATPLVAATPAPAPAPGAPANPAAAPAPAAPAAAEADGIDPAVMALGKAAYANCLACHGQDGKGLPAGAQMMAPPLAGSEILLGDPDLPLLVVLKGIAKESNDFLGMMAPLGAVLDDEKLAAVMTYTRNSFGNSGPAVTVEEAAAARAKFNEVPMMISRAKLAEIAAAHQ